MIELLQLTVFLLLSFVRGSAQYQDVVERVALVGARINTSPYAPPIGNGVILIEGPWIVAVGPSAITPIPQGYRQVDLADTVVTAGVWNSHVHLTTPFSWGLLRRAMDLASTTAISKSVRDRIASGRLAGPRVLGVGEPFFPAGATPIYARPFYEQMKPPSAEVATPQRAAARARQQLRHGADGLKMFTGSIVGARSDDVVSMPIPIAVSVASEARRAGKRVLAHPTNREGVEVALASGFDALAHTALMMGPLSRTDVRRILERHRAHLHPRVVRRHAQFRDTG